MSVISRKDLRELEVGETLIIPFKEQREIEVMRSMCATVGKAIYRRISVHVNRKNNTMKIKKMSPYDDVFSPKGAKREKRDYTERSRRSRERAAAAERGSN